MVYDPSQLRKQRALKALQDGMFTLLSTKSYESIKTVDICKAAMVHRTTFYLHFENKEHLLNVCVHQLKSQLEGELPIDNTTDTLPGYYAKLLKQLVLYLDEHPKLQEGLVSQPSNQVFWLKLQDLIAHDVRQRMQIQRANGYKYHVDLNANAQFFTNGIIGTLLWWLRNHRPIEAIQFFEQIAILMDPRRELKH